jgi:hypothetical protein
MLLKRPVLLGNTVVEEQSITVFFEIAMMQKAVKMTSHAVMVICVTMTPPPIHH